MFARHQIELRHSRRSQVVQRVVFLHEELMKLPFFPRKALESDLDLFQGGELGKVCADCRKARPSAISNEHSRSAGITWTGRAAQVHVGSPDCAHVRSDGRQFRVLRRHPSVSECAVRSGHSPFGRLLHHALRHGDVHQCGVQFQEHFLDQRLLHDHADAAAGLFVPSDKQIGHHDDRVRGEAILHAQPEAVHYADVWRGVGHSGHRRGGHVRRRVEGAVQLFVQSVAESGDTVTRSAEHWYAFLSQLDRNDSNALVDPRLWQPNW